MRKDPKLAAFVPVFLQNRREDAAMMREALARSDYETIGFVAHRMRGSGGMFGFPALTELGAALEAAAQAMDEIKVREKIEELANFVEHAPQA